jgi:hypothetical protein
VSALEMWRRHVLEHPEQYDAFARAAAWELTQMQCQGLGVEWAASIAQRESVIASLQTLRVC